MAQTSKTSAAILGLSLFIGLSVFGYMLSQALIQFKLFDRSVTVKGLSEREYTSDIVIWPIQFTLADNDIGNLYSALDTQIDTVKVFLEKNGIPSSEITINPPIITDKLAQQYGGSQRVEFRYSANQSVTVYSKDVERVRSVMGSLSQLGKQGIALTGNTYQSQTEYLFTRLNEIKPEMIEEATRQAREVALKFAADSKSTLGKIKKASQGQFSIRSRDKNNPHIKRVRVVSTIAYYLSD